MFIRSLAFAVALVLITPPYSIIVLAMNLDLLTAVSPTPPTP